MYLVVFTQCIYSNCVQPLYKFLSFCTCRPYCRFMLCICMCNSYKHRWVYLVIISCWLALCSDLKGRLLCPARVRGVAEVQGLWVAEGTALPGLPNTHHTSEGGKGKDVAVLLYVFLRGISLQKGLYQELQVLVLVRRAQQYLSISNFSSFTLCTLMCCLFIFFVFII